MPSDRRAVIEKELASRPASELDLWMPSLLYRQIHLTSRDGSALLVEAWLTWAEILGRRDVLLEAAGLGVSLIYSYDLKKAIELASLWADLSPVQHEAHGRAQLLFWYANSLVNHGDSEKALAVFRRARRLFEQAGDRRAQGNTYNGEASALLQLGHHDESLAALRSARSLYEQVKDDLGQGNTYLSEADLQLRRGENEKSLAAYRKARSFYEQRGDIRGQANTLRGEGDALCLLGDSEKSLAAYHRAHGLYEQVNDPLGQGNTYRGEGDVLYLLGDSEKSLAAYRNAGKLFELVGDRLGQANAYKGEGDILYILGDNKQSLATYRSARTLFEQVGERLGQGNTYRGEAAVLFRLGDNEMALAAYRSARNLFEQVEDRIGQGNTFLGEAEVLLQLGNNEKSLAAYRSARQLFEQVHQPQGQGYTYFGEADVLFLLGDNKGSLAANRTSRELFERVRDRLGQANTYLHEADVLFFLSDNEKSLTAYRTARTLFEQVGDPLGQGRTELGEARILLRRGERAKSVDLASQAIEHFRRGGSISDERSAWLIKAQAETVDHPELAATSADKAIRLHERWRATLVTDGHRVLEDEAISVAYDVLVPVRIGQQRVSEALSLAEEARSHVLLDLLAPHPLRQGEGSAIDLRAKRQHLEKELAGVEIQIEHASDARQLEDLHDERRRLDRELDWNNYQTIVAEKDTLPQGQPVDAAAIQALSAETGPILLYYSAERELIGFLILPGAAEIFTARIDISRDHLNEQVRGLAHDAANTVYASRAQTRARELWDLLIAPFAPHLPAGGPLVLIPHGPLHELPFEALLDSKGSPLFQRWDVSVAPSVSTLSLARRRHTEAQRQDSFLAFASGRGLDLPVDEVTAISGFFGSNQATFPPDEARFEDYERLVPKARHLLIATNGSYDPDSRRDTYLEIEPTRDVHDSRLSAAEIAAMPLVAELVTLAACDTARSETSLSDERLDLTRAFLIAGAASVLAARWKVPENRATSQFLLDFYRAYRQGGPDNHGQRKDRALTEARRLSRDHGDPAQLWAAWVLVGDPR